MNSPARKHFERVTAALQTSQDSSNERAPANANQYELMLAKLAEDKRRLSTMQSMEKRAALKIELIPDYKPWIEGVIAGNQGVQDDVLMTVMVWAIDAGLIAEALPIAGYAIANKLKMPDQYKRTTAVVVAEEIADFYLKAHNAGQDVDFDIVKATLDITENEDMPDEVKAKLYKVLGYSVLHKIKLENGGVPNKNPNTFGLLNYALECFNRAVLLHEKVGVKKDIESLEREIKNLANA